MHLYTTATEITPTGHSTKKSSTQSIDHSFNPMGHVPLYILRLWGFLCIRDACAGRRSNKITATIKSYARSVILI